MVRRHWPLLVILSLASLVRIGVAVAYRPALFYSDSWGYIDRAFCCRGVSFESYPPSGYPVIMQLLSPVGRQLAVITSVQHVVGLVTGALVYAFLIRARIGRAAAALVAAIVLLDAYAIAIEQHIMAEPMFTLALVACAYLVADPRRRLTWLTASGALLGVALTIRTAGLLVIPIWLAYVLWTYRRPRLIAAAAACLVLPVAIYAAAGAAEGYGGRPVSVILKSGNTGFALYGRIAPIADCRGVDISREARPLCPPAKTREDHGSSWYQWDPSSPARRLYGYSPPPEANQVLREFALAIIRAHPFEYAETVTRDFLGYFDPRGGAVDLALTLPTGPNYEFSSHPIRPWVFPGLRTSVHEPASLMRAYSARIHTPRLFVGLAALVAAIGLVVAAFRRPGAPVPHRHEIFLLLGMALALIVVPVVTIELLVRYLLPAVPLLLMGGTLAVADLGAIVAARRRQAPAGMPRILHERTEAVGEGER
jgi:4-amino-4-deoxy-L-arabinose transferase-like glycosyltransferase